jgi:hypothetical protein
MQPIDYVGCAVRTIGRQSVRAAQPTVVSLARFVELADYIASILDGKDA